MLHKSTKPLALLLALFLVAVGCDDETTGPEDGRATLSVFLTDGPGEVERVWVELLGITAQGGEGGPVELLGEPTELILLTDLVGTVHLLGTQAGLDPTTISQIRMVVGDAILEDAEGKIYLKGDPAIPAGLEEAEQGELQCPSCSQSGIKVKIPNDEMELDEGASALILDFVVSQSFGHRAGNSGKWVMHPVIHGTLVADEDGNGEILEELGLTGSITGTVAWGEGVLAPTCATAGERPITDFVPTAKLLGITDGEGNPIVMSGAVSDQGGTFGYTIAFLPSGTYEMGFLSPITIDQEQVTFEASVTPGTVTVSGPDPLEVNYVITSAGCGAVG